MSVRSAIRRAIPVLAEHGHVDRGVLLAWLIRAGLSRGEAAAALRFVPLAFGRKLLAGMGVALSDIYIRMNGDARDERRLADEPFFTEATKIADDVLKALFGPIALQSSEVQAVNGALNAGAEASGLVASPPVIEWDEEIDTIPPPAPWWKFW